MADTQPSSPIDSSALNQPAATLQDPSRAESRIEDIWGYLPRVTTTPTWNPTRFYQSLAMDESENKLYYYDFTGETWRAVDAITLTAGSGITITPTGQSYEISAAVSQLKQTYTAAAAISAGNAVIIGKIPDSPTISNFPGFGTTRSLSNAAFPTTNGLRAQTFTATGNYLHKVECQIDHEDETSITVEMQVQSTSAGAPSGTAISSTASYSFTDSTNNGGTRNQLTALFDFSSSPVAITPSTKYAIVIRYSSYSGAGTPGWAVGADTLGSENEYNRTGGSWVSGISDMSFKTYESLTKSGQIYQADASANDEFANNFIGFATTTVSADQTTPVVVAGIVTGLSGLSTGNTYYLSDTAGAIQTTAGTQSRKIGLALSSTTLLNKHDNQ